MGMKFSAVKNGCHLKIIDYDMRGSNMGSYLNPGNGMFRRAISSEIFVDKTGLIRETNKVINTQQLYLCVSRPRRFGKSMCLNMLSAYYDCDADSHGMFEKFEIASDPSFEDHLGKYDVFFLDMSKLLAET
jgi:hypothetical protein